MNFNEFKTRFYNPEGRLLEDEIYRFVWEEIQSGQLDSAAQARSIEEGEGNDGKTRSAYIKYRVRRMKDELELEAARAKEKEVKPTHNYPDRSASKLRKEKDVCSFCGAKFGFFCRTRASGLCSDCYKKISGTKNRIPLTFQKPKFLVGYDAEIV